MSNLLNVSMGDTLIVMLDRSGAITTNIDESVRTVRLDVLAALSASYLVHVPRAVHVSHSKPLKRGLQERLGISPHWIGTQVVAVPPTAVTRCIINTDGTWCNWCAKWYPMAGSNQDDGAFKCYKCTQNPYAKRQIT